MATYVIADIHGEYELFLELLDKMKQILFIFLETPSTGTLTP